MPDIHGSLLMQSALYHDRRNFFYPLIRSESDITKEHLFDTIHSPQIFMFYNKKGTDFRSSTCKSTLIIYALIAMQQPLQFFECWSILSAKAFSMRRFRQSSAQGTISYSAKLFCHILLRFICFISSEALTPKLLWITVQRVARAKGVELNIPDSKSLSDVMDGFTTQVGYPLLTTTLNNYGRVDVEQVASTK